jgi:hypothetical protein
MDNEKTQVRPLEYGAATGSALTFSEHKEQTAKDCEAIADIMTKLAAACREGDMGQFERMLIEGGTEEGDAKIAAIREIAVLRYMHRQERMEPNAEGQHHE